MNKMYWSRAVKERDGWKCRVCGSSERLQAHHISFARNDPERILDIDNGITLCHKHHLIAHRGLYSGSGSVMQHTEWFTPESIAEVEAVINQAIIETMERDKAKGRE